MANRGPEGDGRVVLEIPVNACDHPDGRMVHVRQYKQGQYIGFSRVGLHAGEVVRMGNRGFADNANATWGCPE